MSSKKNKNTGIVIVKPGANAPSNLLANAEIHFSGGLLAGIRLTGISLWLAHRKDETTFVSVTFPSREVMKADRSDYFAHVRGDKESLRRLSQRSAIEVNCLAAGLGGQHIFCAERTFTSLPIFFRASGNPQP